MAAEDRCQMSVMLTSKDVKKSVQFYRDQLGFELKECWPDENEPQWTNLVLNGQSMMVGAAVDPDKVDQMCQGDEEAARYWKKAAEAFRKNQPGVGIQVYVMVPDVDAYYAEIQGKGVHVETAPKTQFYGIRDFGVNDPDGYRLVIFAPIAMSSCQSCGMPLADGEPGQMYCHHCTDDKGTLHPYEAILEGTVSGYFMGVGQMSRPDAEKAAREHLARMPAWSGRC